MRFEDCKVAHELAHCGLAVTKFPPFRSKVIHLDLGLHRKCKKFLYNLKTSFLFGDESMEEKGKNWRFITLIVFKVTY